MKYFTTSFLYHAYLSLSVSLFCFIISCCRVRSSFKRWHCYGWTVALCGKVHCMLWTKLCQT